MEAANPGACTSSPPLVSGIMPTADRRHLVARAVAYFLRQDYPNKELVVVDDGAAPVADLMPEDDRVRYVRRAPRRTIGVKRNLACEHARGEIIIHWDDDDWAAPWRLRYQAEHLLRANADVCGLAAPYLYDPTAARAWQYVFPGRGRPWVHGATLGYRKAFWQRNPFADVQIGEDSRFVWRARPKKVLVLPDTAFYVGLIHAGNTSPKRTAGRRWRSVPPAEIQKMLGSDWAGFAHAQAADAQPTPVSPQPS